MKVNLCTRVLLLACPQLLIAEHVF